MTSEEKQALKDKLPLPQFIYLLRTFYAKELNALVERREELVASELKSIEEDSHWAISHRLHRLTDDLAQMDTRITMFDSLMHVMDTLLDRFDATLSAEDLRKIVDFL